MNNLVYLSDTSVDIMNKIQYGGVGIDADNMCTYMNYALIAVAICTILTCLITIIGMLKDSFHMKSKWLGGLTLEHWCSCWLFSILLTGGMAFFVKKKCLDPSLAGDYD
jgi:hypothetical protein